MKIFLVIAMSFILNADSLKKTNTIQVIIKNEEIYFIQNDPEDDVYNDSIERENAFNVVEVEFKNMSNKKMLLFINPEELFFNHGYSSNYFYHGSFISKGYTKAETSFSLVTFSGSPDGLDNIEKYKSEIRKFKYKKLNLTEREMAAFEMFERHAFYLSTNQTKTMYFHINLPIVRETNYEIQQNPFRFINLNEGDDFKFVYEAFSKNIYNDLPEFVKEELRNNKIEIFDGKIVSNAVKLKKR
jgi:hypothetical protein